MSAILGVFGGAGGGGGGAAGPGEQLLYDLLGRMSRTEDEARQVLAAPDGGLGVCRAGWELASGFSGRVLVLEEGDIAVAADASLYYRQDLAAGLARHGVRAGGDTSSHLILAAYRAWGEDCAARLEGDFAFIVWDRLRGRIFCARDHSGSRSLYYAHAGGTLVVASTIAAVLGHPACPQELNLACLAEAAAGSLGASEETAFRAVSAVLPGGSLRWSPGRPVRAARFWEPPPIEDRAERIPFDEAAEELRGLLGRAVLERVPESERAGIWLSGGWDSTAVFGAGKQALSRRGREADLLAVSLRYPEGDPGHEDGFVRAVTDRWDSVVHWLDVGGIPLLDGIEERAGGGGEPHAHPFEATNRALAARTAELGARVALTGKGGDELFAVSDVYLADLVRRGNWLRLAREWRSYRARGLRRFFRYAVQPLLPGPLTRPAARLLGVPDSATYLQRPLPEWIDADFARTHRLAERQGFAVPRRRGEGFAAYEMAWSLTHPVHGRIYSQVFGFALDHGVELRSPLFDTRIIRLAASRPWWERCSGHETKRLLRRAARGLVPDEVLAPRATRTGVSSGYLDTELRKRYAGLVSRVFERPVLAELGIIDASALKRAWAGYQTSGAINVGSDILFTLQAELWASARLAGRAPPSEGSELDPSRLAVAG